MVMLVILNRLNRLQKKGRKEEEWKEGRREEGGKESDA